MNASGSPHEEITLGLVRAVREIRWADIPAPAREVARHCLLDCLGTAIAGSREPLTEILVREIAASEGSSQAGLIGRRERASRLTAALVSAAAAHALDFDDDTGANGKRPRNRSERGHPRGLRARSDAKLARPRNGLGGRLKWYSPFPRTAQ